MDDGNDDSGGDGYDDVHGDADGDENDDDDDDDVNDDDDDDELLCGRRLVDWKKLNLFCFVAISLGW